MGGAESPKSKQKVAILGGGVAAMTAAFELTDQPGWAEKYEIDVYQVGWRLGGKGASGRNAKHGMRIEEHGLHIWLGFYDNAFKLMKRCYDELGRPATAPLATCRDAFSDHNTSELMEEVAGEWRIWPIAFPPNGAELGTGGLALRPWDYVGLMSKWLVGLFTGADLGENLLDGLAKFSPMDWVRRVFEETVETLAIDLHLTSLHAVQTLIREMPPRVEDHTPEQHQAIVSLLESFQEQWFAKVADEVEQDDALRRLGILLDLGISAIRGLIADGAIFHGYDALDEEDFQDWLTRHGLRHGHRMCAPIRALYDLVFAYEEGDIDRPNMAAGVAMRIIMRMFFSYKAAIFQKMAAGMGDTVFAPLYLVLKRRGVRFHFFHKVKSLELSDDREEVARIQIGVQATPRAVPGEYDPLIDVKGLPCWPSLPLYDRIAEGEALEASGSNLELSWSTWEDVGEITLERGRDFDSVVLGISIGAFPYVCRELMAARAEWRDMVDRVKTVRTRAFQLWLSKTSEALGWPIPHFAQMGAYVEPLDTWADMSHLLPMEDWPEGLDVRNVSYYCGALKDTPLPDPPFSDPNYPHESKALVRERAIAFLESRIRPLWPRGCSTTDPEGLDWALLIDLKNAEGKARFLAQYWRANVEPTERYVMSVKGSTRYRLKPGDSKFRNLVLAGDWTYNGLNAGCVEAAVMSGMMASRALTGLPEDVVGETDLALGG